MTLQDGWAEREARLSDRRNHQLVMLGVSHRTAPLAVRERLTVSARELPDAYRLLQQDPPITEVVLLSTCHRTEAYAVARDPADGLAHLTDFFRFHSRLSERALQACCYTVTGMDTARHLFRVAAGMDSVILGESEITAQTKQAYLAAYAHGATGSGLNRLFQRSLRCAKAIRSTTALGRGQGSVGSVVAALTRQVFGGRLAQCEVLLWGAGKAAEATARHLIKTGIRRLWVVNRTPARARELAGLCEGGWLSWEQALRHLAHVDIAIVCTQAPHYVIDAGDMDELAAQRGTRPLLLVDLAVPRNIDPAVARLPGVTLYNIDDLQEGVAAALAQRREALPQGEVVIAGQVQHFSSWWDRQRIREEEVALCPAVAQ